MTDLGLQTHVAWLEQSELFAFFPASGVLVPAAGGADTDVNSCFRSVPRTVPPDSCPLAGPHLHLHHHVPGWLRGLAWGFGGW